MPLKPLVLLAGMILATQVPDLHAQADSARSDSAFHALQQRGAMYMGVNQYTSTHHFESLPDGGRIELQRDASDTTDINQIRQHLREIALAFQHGDFQIPGMVHDQEVPGTAVMTAHRADISYAFHELPRGGEVRITSRDSAAVDAIHQFLAFQRHEHHASQ